MPGSPGSDALHTRSSPARALHPLAWILALLLVGAGLTVNRSWADLGAASAVLAVLALRVERRPWHAEAPLWALALVVFLVHVIAAGNRTGAVLGEAAAVAFRLLALLYLLRWAARSGLGPIGRWLMGFPPPRRPRAALVLFESARLIPALLPLALREAEQHALALKARGVRAGRGVRGFSRYLLAWFLPFLGTVLRISDAYADALIVRGYRPGQRRRTGLSPRWGGREWAAVGGSAVFAVWLIRGV